MKVLIADPDWQFSQRAVNYLESLANMVSSQPSASDAASTAEKWQPDMIIIAAQYVDDGSVNLDELYELDSRPAVVLTEHMARYDRAWRAWQKGGDELLMKPIFKTDELWSAVKAAMENAATGQRLRRVAVSA